MDYKEYIKNALQAYTTDYVINVVNEIDFNYNPNDNEILVVIKELSGSVNGDVRFMPIQFNIFTLANEVNETKKIFNKFVNDYSNTHMSIGFDHYKQDYSTPIDMNNFIEIGETQRAELIVTGTLLITANLSDITQLKINNSIINYTSISFGYSTSPNASRLKTDNLQKVMVANANLQITVTTFCQNDLLSSLISLSKTGNKSPNDTFSLEITYSNGNVENYTCRINSYAENYDITNPPRRTLVFYIC